MVDSTILLASSSPRRQQMVGWMGIPFRVHPAAVDESSFDSESPEVYVARLARQKAEAVHHAARTEEIVLAADTIVVDQQDLLGKPDTREAARAMLVRLRSRVHVVYTAICLYSVQTRQFYTDICASQVPMRNYSDAEIDAYIDSGDPMDKAGGYAIQNQVFHPVVNFSQCYACVMGLPICHLVRVLQVIGSDPGTYPPDLCRNHLGYPCSIYGEILTQGSTMVR